MNVRRLLLFSSWVGAAALTVLAWSLLPAPRVTSSQHGEQAAQENEAARSNLPAEQRQRWLTHLAADRWHQTGQRGRGVKVAILDSGFRGYKDHLGKHLPEKVQARSFRKDGNLEARDSQHGILCAEVVHTLAPQADMLFANWDPDNPDSFLAAVQWAREQGARVLSCSLIMPSWSDGDGGGPIHAQLEKLLQPRADATEILCFACAGNTALRHWSGGFRLDERGWHHWQPGQPANQLLPWGPEPVSVELYGPTQVPCEILVYQIGTEKVVGRGPLRSQSGSWGCCGKAVVRFEPESGVDYEVRLHCPSQHKLESERFHLVALGANLGCASATGSIPFPGDGKSVVTIGAIDEAGRRRTYSSCGPNSPLPKPDFVAKVPFPTLCRERPFAGTSAAAPQGAGLAALLWSKNASWSAQQVRTALRQSAIDLHTPGHDHETGYGWLKLP